MFKIYNVNKYICIYTERETNMVICSLLVGSWIYNENWKSWIIKIIELK